MANFLENVALRRNDLTLAGIIGVEIKMRPLVLVNIYHWQVFNDDYDLLNFLHCIDQYESQEIDCSALVQVVDKKEIVFGNEVVQLKTNKIPKGLVALEWVFDGCDRLNTKVSPTNSVNLEEINLGTDNAPNKVYIGKRISPNIMQMIIDLLRKY